MKTVILVQITYSSDHTRLAYWKGIEILNINYMFLKSRFLLLLEVF